MDTNIEDVKKHVSMLSDEALLEVQREELVEEARVVYEAEAARRGLSWPVSGDEELPPVDLAPGAKLVAIVSYETPDEARFGRDLLRNEQIPAWLAAELTQLRLTHDSENPLDLLVPSNFVEQAELLLNSEVSDEELIRQAEESATRLPPSMREEDVEEVPTEPRPEV